MASMAMQTTVNLFTTSSALERRRLGSGPESGTLKKGSIATGMLTGWFSVIVRDVLSLSMNRQRRGGRPGRASSEIVVPVVGLASKKNRISEEFVKLREMGQVRSSRRQCKFALTFRCPMVFRRFFPQSSGLPCS